MQISQAVKSLSTSPVTNQHKALVANNVKLNQANSSLAAWMEQARYFYDAVISGREPQPEPAKWQEFLRQMEWATDQLGLDGNWDPTANRAPQGDEEADEGSDPFNGIAGPNKNWIHNEAEAEWGFLGKAGTVRDSWANKNTINVAPGSSSVKVSETTDTRLNPPEKVVKVEVYDRATRTTETYFIHDFVKGTDQLIINVPDGVTVSDAGNLAKKGKFTKDSGKTESSIPGEAFADGKIYEAETVSDTLEFRPQAGENEAHYVVGNAEISIPLSSKVTVLKSENGEFDYKIVVKHKDPQPDGSTDTYYVRKEFSTNINAVKDYVTFDLDGNGQAEGEAGKVPSDLKDIIKINGDATAATSDSKNAEPTSVEDNGKTAIYEDEKDPFFINNFDGSFKDYVITANGTLTLIPNKQSDQFTVTLEERDGKVFYLIQVIGKDSAGNQQVIYYHVDADQIEKIDIKDVSESQVNVLFANGPQILGLSSEQQEKYEDKIKIDGQSIDDITEAEEKEEALNQELPAVIQKLADFTDTSEETLLEVIKEVYGQENKEEAEFRQWLTTHFNSPTLDSDFIKVLLKADPKLSQALKELDGEEANRNTINSLISQFQYIGQRMEEGLEKIFGGDYTVSTWVPTITILSGGKSVGGFSMKMEDDTFQTEDLDKFLYF